MIGKIVYGVYAFIGSTVRVFAVVMYFSVPLGLFNILTHWRYETLNVKWQEFEYACDHDYNDDYDYYVTDTDYVVFTEIVPQILSFKFDNERLLDYEKPIKFSVYNESEGQYKNIYIKNISKLLLTNEPYTKYSGIPLGWSY